MGTYSIIQYRSIATKTRVYKISLFLNRMQQVEVIGHNKGLIPTHLVLYRQPFPLISPLFSLGSVTFISHHKLSYDCPDSPEVRLTYVSLKKRLTFVFKLYINKVHLLIIISLFIAFVFVISLI